jgi:hypothetical protein
VVQVFQETPTAAPAAPRHGPVLTGNFPNPFNPSTTIRYVPANDVDPLKIAIHDLAGRQIRELFQGVQAAVPHEVNWDGRDAANRVVASGVYVYALTQSGQTVARRMVLLK